MSEQLETVSGPIPGEQSCELLARLSVRESQNVTAVSADFPVVWESASGAIVSDVDGNEYIDLTSAFGVAAVGHSNPYVASAIADQAVRLIHGMGDVHPTEVRIELLERLAGIAPKELNRTYLATTGSEAVEVALKSAMLATGKSAFASFRNGYHGLSFGALRVTGIEKLRAPFAAALGESTLFLEYPRAGHDGRSDADSALERLRNALAARDDLAALILEPIQGRGGVIVPPAGYLRGVREICSERGIVMILDEIWTGFGRTGSMFACELEGVVPDILCIGKAMGGGVPIAATMGRESIMNAWPLSSGEALHTSTFLGNPIGCAAALATIGEIERNELPARAKQLGVTLVARLGNLQRHKSVVDVRGRGLMWGIELTDAHAAERAVKSALQLGVILLQAGAEGNVLSITPPLTIGERQLYRAIDILDRALAQR
ncbi:MAG TPA: aspartate aminotransferase family protein [Candidatus Dormibacteraeota bacterium]|nr:aspartate aminotransferase family protein [Candidatus Dormibacteraeota bacterium]